jgi:hypothetical protein
MKMHTDEQCATKLKGIKMLSEQLMKRHKGDDMDNYALSESITVMCVELLREFPDDKEE